MVSNLRYFGGGGDFSAICFGIIVGNFSLDPATGGFIIPLGTIDGTLDEDSTVESSIDLGMTFIISGRRLIREARSGFFSGALGFVSDGFSGLGGRVFFGIGGGGAGFSCWGNGSVATN